MSQFTSHEVYGRVTGDILAAVAAGPQPFQMPWSRAAGGRPVNIASGKPYRGINTLALWAAGQARGYATSVWGTYRQWQARKGQVRKGEQACLAVLWKEVGRGSDSQGEDQDAGKGWVMVRGFHVFNLDQVDGCIWPAAAPLAEDQRLAQAEAFIAALRIPTVFGAEAAYYHLTLDQVFMPDFGAFEDAHGFYATYLHECAHATGAKSRLDRDFGGRWTGQTLALEEMTAELTAAFLLADLGVAHHPRPDHAAYIASWMELLRDEPRAIFAAAGKAQQAADWMQAQQPRLIADRSQW